MKKLLSILLTIAMLLTCIPLTAVSVSAASVNIRLYSDGSWKVSSNYGIRTGPIECAADAITFIGNEYDPSYVLTKSGSTIKSGYGSNFMVDFSAYASGTYTLKYVCYERGYQNGYYTLIGPYTVYFTIQNTNSGGGSTVCTKHTYTNACDTTCNNCGATRTISHDYAAATCLAPKTCRICGVTTGSKGSHSYSNSCDTTCNTCGSIRHYVTHTYSASCDEICNICGFEREVSHTYTESTPCFGCGLMVVGDFRYYISDGEATLTKYTGSALNVTIPATVGDYPVTAIEGPAFSSAVVWVSIPDSVTTIGEGAFENCTNLTSIIIPDSVTSIGFCAFYECISLTSITIPDSVTSIGHSAFASCDRLTSVTIPGSVTSIGTMAFWGCGGLTSVTISNGVTEIGSYAFKNCYCLASTTIPESVTRINYGAFSECFMLSDVYYLGTEEQMQCINFDSYNNELLNATWHYNSCIGKAEHTYANACDTSCNICDFTRTTKHNYSAATCTAPKSCKDCGQTVGKALGHTYKAATCTKAKTCKLCGVTTGKALGHKYTTVTKAATATANGYTVKRCSVCKKETGKTTIYKASSIKLSKTTYVYNGKAQKPSVVVKDAKGKAISSSNYTVTYASGRKNVGTYKVTVKMKGNYTGTKTLTFKINPPKTTVKATAAKKSLKLTIGKKSTQVTGYEVQYSTSKSFKTYKSKTLTSYKKTSLTLTGLKAKTTYYVRVRTYKVVNGKKVYSAWSANKSVKTK